MRTMIGRRPIRTSVDRIDESNIAQVLQRVFPIHAANSAEIDWLYRYYRGDQPILQREKAVRPEICNRIVENRANEIVSFKTGYLMGEPVQYVSRGDDPAIAAAIGKLNDYVLSEEKESHDRDLMEWAHICGTSYRVVLPDAQADVAQDEAPFEFYTMDPRRTFVVYSDGLGERPMMAVTYRDEEDGKRTFSCYTEDRYFELDSGWRVLSVQEQALGMIPIIEYPLNRARLGAFEIVLPLLDAINTVESNRIDGVEQFVQALMLFHNVDISEKDFAELREQGAIKYRDIDPQFKADISYLCAELDQGQTQTLKDSMYDTVLTICGMPNRNGGSSTSDTGTAVVLRDGWSAAEARAKDTELMFKRSEKQMLKVLLKICRALGPLDLRLSQLEIRFTRRNYENISEKANVLNLMLTNDKIHPRLAFEHSGLFVDPDLAYQISKSYYDELRPEPSPIKTEEVPPNDGEGAE